MSTTENQTARDAKQPPLVQGLIMDGIEHGGSALRTTLRSIDQRVLIWCWGLGTVGIFAFVLVGSMVSSPSVTGVLQGLFGGFMIALMFAAAFGGLLLWARSDRTKGPASATSTRAAELDARLAPALRELTTLRTDIIAQVKARSVMRVPLGTAAGVVAWILARRGDDPPGVFELGLFVIIGALAGEYWAVYKLERQYRRRYKDSVLPQITSQLGDLSYREASRDDVERLGALQIDPFAGADQIRKSPQKNWVPVSGVGDTAYFYKVQDIYAEMIVWSGSHHFAIQMEVPIGSTAEQLKPNTIQLANLIIPKLK